MWPTAGSQALFQNQYLNETSNILILYPGSGLNFFGSNHYCNIILKSMYNYNKTIEQIMFKSNMSKFLTQITLKKFTK